MLNTMLSNSALIITVVFGLLFFFLLAISFWPLAFYFKILLALGFILKAIYFFYLILILEIFNFKL
jgi:hypothetical protein